MTDECAAPPSARQIPAPVSRTHGIAIQRWRRRGPRSLLARLRRSVPKRCRSLPGTPSGEFEGHVPDNVSNLPHDEFSVSLPLPSEFAATEIESNSDQINSLHDRRIIRPRRDVNREELVIFMVNIQCLRARASELQYQLAKFKPYIVCIQETWLDVSTELFVIAGYIQGSRRDRADEPNRGGIVT